MRYRSEVDGLRAIAVVSVILYHAGFGDAEGGYLGVDIFFVISGYLITTLIAKDLQDGRFSIVNFYERRARRILPALFLVMLACVPAAWLILPADAMTRFAQSVLATALFGSNFLFWAESGYFDTAAELKPLLHTWSLAVEEQYYILFPLMLMLLWRFGKVWIWIAFALFFAVSLGLAQWSTTHAPGAGFFLLHTRFWELLAGAAVAIFLFGRERLYPRMLLECSSAFGLLLVLWSIARFDEGTPHPSVETLLPVLGTALILLFARENTIVGRMLSWRPMVGIGLISYSAYLWHQPLFIFARYLSTEDLERWVLVTLILVTFVLAYFSWRFVEQPFRVGGWMPGKKILAMGGVGIATFVVAASVTIQAEGIPNRLPKLISKLAYEADYGVVLDRGNEVRVTYDLPADTKWRKIFKVGPKDREAKRKVLVIGDSHAMSLCGFAASIASQSDTEFVFNTYAGCLPLKRVYKIFRLGESNKFGNLKDLCREQGELWEEFITENADEFDSVIVAARWNHSLNDRWYAGRYVSRHAPWYADRPEPTEISVFEENASEALGFGLDGIVRHIQDQGLKVLLFSQAPVLNTDVKKCLFHLQPECGVTDYALALERDQAMHKIASESGLFEDSENVYFRLFPVFCDEAANRCAPRNGELVYYNDDNHMSEIGSVKAAKYFLEKHPDFF